LKYYNTVNAKFQIFTTASKEKEWTKRGHKSG